MKAILSLMRMVRSGAQLKHRKEASILRRINALCAVGSDEQDRLTSMRPASNHFTSASLHDVDWNEHTPVGEFRLNQIFLVAPCRYQTHVSFFFSRPKLPT